MMTMMRKIHPISILALGLGLLLLAGCSGSGEAEPADAAGDEALDRPMIEPVDEAELTASIENVHAVRCGCSLEEVGKCGNYIEVDGKFVPLVASAELGVEHMAFCGKEDLTAHVEGEVRGGNFVATGFAYVEPESGG